MNEGGMSSWKSETEFTYIMFHGTFKGMGNDESVGSICFVEGEYGLCNAKHKTIVQTIHL